MVHGVGIDLIHIDKIRSLCRGGRRLLDGDLFSREEFRDAGIDESDESFTDQQMWILASKFAAKEAAIKALGLPWDADFIWSDIIVHGRGTISVEMTGRIREFMGRMGNIITLTGYVSMSRTHAMAFIIGELK